MHGWKIQSTPNASGGSVNALYRIACSSATRCTAVGSYKNTSGTTVTLAQRWNGIDWFVQSTPNPSGVTFSLLFDVSCPAMITCTAVGNYQKNTTLKQTVPLAESWNGASWVIQSTPVPNGALGSALSGVSCRSATVCTAVGFYVNSSGVRLPLVERWNGTAWSIQAAPKPSGAKAATLYDVACPSTSLCLAVGNYVNSSSVTVTLVERWNGSKWSIQPSPNPSGATATMLTDVACPSTTSCTSVGNAVNSASVLVPLAERWNGTSWTVQATPTPAGAVATVLSGVSCPSTTSCTAVGAYANSSNVTVTLAEHWNGSAWTVQLTPNPAAAKSSRLFGVSCATTALCEGVWQYVNSSNVQLTLAEGYS
ncbi:MAG: hypothetical protein E6J45_04350 [Chloroflexi bacterium]|nr:MAG: hypothetical protein E6J45_04350 [Chloroflexota bacterium]